MAILGSELEKRIASLTTLRDNLKNSIENGTLSDAEKTAIRKALTEVKTDLSIQVQRSEEMDKTFKDYINASQELSDLKDRRNEIFSEPGSEVYATEYDKLIEQARERYNAASFRKDFSHNYISIEALQKDLAIIDEYNEKFFSDPDFKFPDLEEIEDLADLPEFVDERLTRLMNLYGINDITVLENKIMDQIQYQKEHPEETLQARIKANEREIAQKEAASKKEAISNPVSRHRNRRTDRYKAAIAESITPEKEEAPTHRRISRVERGKLNGIYNQETDQTPIQKTENVKTQTVPTQKTETPKVQSIPIKKIETQKTPAHTPEVKKPQTYSTPAANLQNPTRAKPNTYNMDSKATPTTSPLLAIRDNWVTRFKNWIKDKLKKEEPKAKTSKEEIKKKSYKVKEKKDTPLEEILFSVDIEENDITTAVDSLRSLGHEPQISDLTSFYHYKILRSEDGKSPDKLAYVREDISKVLENPAEAYAETLNDITNDKKMITAMRRDVEHTSTHFSDSQLRRIAEITSENGKAKIEKPTKENTDTYIKRVLLLKSLVEPHLLNLAHSYSRPENIEKMFNGEIENGRNVNFTKEGNILTGISYSMQVEHSREKIPSLGESYKASHPMEFAKPMSKTKNTTPYERPTQDKESEKDER